jgi:hypothetical protein
MLFWCRHEVKVLVWWRLKLPRAESQLWRALLAEKHRELQQIRTARADVRDGACACTAALSSRACLTLLLRRDNNSTWLRGLKFVLDTYAKSWQQA